jgi:membrane associated rhomboid family serine protease
MTPVTKNLLIINVLAFLAMLTLRSIGVADLNDVCGLHFFMASDFSIYQLFTYMFMHAGWEHIILNMFMLWMFGVVVESAMGPKRFLFYYIFCGVGAGVMQEIAQFFWLYYQFNSQEPLSIATCFSVMHQMAGQLNGLTTVGASGAIYALLLAFGMMFPNEKMFIIPIPVPIKAKWMVIGSIVVELLSGLGQPGDNVAHLAHLGGMIFGFLLLKYWQHHNNPYSSDPTQEAQQFFGRMKTKWENRREAHTISGEQPHVHDSNPDWDYNERKKADQEEIDRILDKIRKSGYDSLSREEKQRLFDLSKK